MTDDSEGEGYSFICNSTLVCINCKEVFTGIWDINGGKAPQMCNNCWKHLEAHLGLKRE